jgi:pre-mRNA 3'-end-processing factor FIP1
MLPPKPSTIRGVDFDAQGIINGQPTYEHDILNAYKDEEKPWKKPGADITDYFNYGFTEEIWAQYCDRQRRLRADNNLSRLNVAHVKKIFQFLIIFCICNFLFFQMPPMPPMIPGHPPMIHPMNPHPMMMINKPMNMAMIQRPMNIRKPDGKIGVIGKIKN